MHYDQGVEVRNSYAYSNIFPVGRNNRNISTHNPRTYDRKNTKTTFPFPCLPPPPHHARLSMTIHARQRKQIYLMMALMPILGWGLGREKWDILTPIAPFFFSAYYVGNNKQTCIVNAISSTRRERRIVVFLFFFKKQTSVQQLGVDWAKLTYNVRNIFIALIGMLSPHWIILIVGVQSQTSFRHETGIPWKAYSCMIF